MAAFFLCCLNRKRRRTVDSSSKRHHVVLATYFNGLCATRLLLFVRDCVTMCTKPKKNWNIIMQMTRLFALNYLQSSHVACTDAALDYGTPRSEKSSKVSQVQRWLVRSYLNYLPTWHVFCIYTHTESSRTRFWRLGRLIKTAFAENGFQRYANRRGEVLLVNLRACGSDIWSGIFMGDFLSIGFGGFRADTISFGPVNYFCRLRFRRNVRSMANSYSTQVLYLSFSLKIL